MQDPYVKYYMVHSLPSQVICLHFNEKSWCSIDLFAFSMTEWDNDEPNEKDLVACSFQSYLLLRLTNVQYKTLSEYRKILLNVDFIGSNWRHY